MSRKSQAPLCFLITLDSAPRLNILQYRHLDWLPVISVAAISAPISNKLLLALLSNGIIAMPACLAWSKALSIAVISTPVWTVYGTRVNPVCGVVKSHILTMSGLTCVM